MSNQHVSVHPDAERIAKMFDDTVRKYWRSSTGMYLDWEVKEVPEARAPDGVIYQLVPVMMVEFKW